MKDQQRDAIPITMPAKFFTEYTLRKFIQDMKNMNTIDGFTWWRTCRNIPTTKVMYAYFVFGGKVQYRADVSSYEKNKTMDFPRPDGDRRIFENKNWIVLCGPVIKAPYDIPMKGFRGFRYTELIF